MNQLEALFFVLSLCVIAGWLLAFLPISISPFKSRSAMIHFGSAIGILLFNLLPVLSDGPLLNRTGEQIPAVALFFATLFPASFFLVLAIRAEMAGRR